MRTSTLFLVTLGMVGAMAARASEPPELPLAGAMADVPEQAADVEQAVWSMLAGFASGSESEYVAWMTEDFRFVTDDPEFQASFPSGMTREDERVFAAHLFHGGKVGPDGVPLPHAVAIDTVVRPLAMIAKDPSGARARIVLDRVHVRIHLSNDTVLELSEARNEMELVLTPNGWRVQRWLETHLEGSAERGTEPGPAESEGAVPDRLALAVRADRSRDAMLFDLSLPRAGGELELFDVMGRRIARRRLDGMPAGRHTVSLDGPRPASGVYWARLVQPEARVVVKVVWVR